MAFKFKQIFSSAGEGGNRRLFMIGGVVGTLVIGVLALSSIHHREMPQSNAGVTQAVNPLPGGLNATPKQEELRKQDLEEGATTAQNTGQSFTPDLAPGKSANPPEPVHEVGEVGQDEDPSMAKRLPSPPSPQVAEIPAQPLVQTSPAYAVAPVDGQGGNPKNKLYADAIADLRKTLSPHMPVTSVMYTQDELTPKDEPSASSKANTSKSPENSLSQAASNSTSTQNKVLIPAGRGIYAHTVTATNSDLNGDVILEADSGPIAGDRMIASVSRAGGHMNRLVLAVRSVMHKGQTLSVTGMVVAPRTMEAAVASSVDQLYVERFLLPGAAAFVQRLGSALETTSNTVGSIGGLGNVNYVERLNFPQQLGVAAGQAASQIKSALMQQMPTQPRVNLAANVSVGVVFTANVTAKQ
ncbi:DotG/IcmE/VirB10 family protein [Acetobacter pasteurianus]|uniref:Type IV secretion protein DotG n=1 Tax=Acetobacter pasteurianus TaxID=438 RepID=A0A0S3JPK0_ACEPA|nr:type IV secretion protein DotG [Acetobacter pasteurianus]ALR88329.1 type IV secretion protein DotG [Acetobacter pasteurianus]